MTAFRRASSWIIAGAAVCGAAGVITGAISAHGFDSDPSGAEAARRLRLASEYLLWHAAPLLFCAVQLARPAGAVGAPRWMVLIALLFGAGALLFCGSLTALAFGAPDALTEVTPLGGTALILAWLNLAVWAILRATTASR